MNLKCFVLCLLPVLLSLEVVAAKPMNAAKCDSPDNRPIMTVAEYKARMKEFPPVFQSFPTYFETEGYPAVLLIRENADNGKLRFEEVHKAIFGSYTSAKPTDIVAICLESEKIRVILAEDKHVVDLKDGEPVFMGKKIVKSSQKNFEVMKAKLSPKIIPDSSNPPSSNEAGATQ